MPMPSLVLRFDGIILDLGRGRFIGPAEDVPLRRKSFGLLCKGAPRPGQILSKGDLIAPVWPDVAVSDGSLAQDVRAVSIPPTPLSPK